MEPWAARIHDLLKTTGKTQAALARACKVKPGSISGWFGKGTPTKMISGDNLVAAAVFLGTTAEFIMTGRNGIAVPSQPAGFDDATMSAAVELLYLAGAARPEDWRFKRFNWAMVQVAAQAVKEAEGDTGEAMALLLAAVEQIDGH